MCKIRCKLVMKRKATNYNIKTLGSKMTDGI